MPCLESGALGIYANMSVPGYGEVAHRPKLYDKEYECVAGMEQVWNWLAGVELELSWNWRRTVVELWWN